jgi:4-diphosphocytidyl-2-C-methyl-D-erythritol kinase
MICFPTCKINIGLFITEKRTDGYHNLETIFYPVPLNDILEITEGIKNEFTSSGLVIPGNRESNLCIKAYDSLRGKYKLPPVKIHLHKAIPTGAGLGGGSSDAAFMLKLLNDHFALNIGKEELLDTASRLGSDCAFFIESKPVFAKNKGDYFENSSINLKNYFLVLVKPDVHISTPEAYSLIKPRKAPYSLKNIDIAQINDWKNFIINDFEEPLFLKFPEIKNIKETLYNAGAIYASMSGSGSAVYGIFKDAVDLSELFNRHFVWQGQLL